MIAINDGVKKHNFKNRVLLFVFEIMILINLISFTKYSSFIPGLYVIKYVLFFIFIISLVVSLGYKIGKFSLKYLMLLCILVIVMTPSLSNTTNSTLASTVLLVIMSVLISCSALFIFPKIDKELFMSLVKIMFFTLAFFIIIPNFIVTFNQNYYYVIGYRTRFIGFFNNANELARFLALGCLLGVRILPAINKKITRLFIFCTTMASIYIIYLTNSRAALLLIFSTFAFLFLNYCYRKNGKIMITMLLVLTITIIVIFSLPVLKNLNYNYINELSSGRINIWQEVLNDRNIFELLFGVGSERIGISSALVLTNGYFEILMYYGVLGLLFWIWLIAHLLHKKRNSSKYILSAITTDSITIVTAFLVYYFFEGGLISVGNIAGIYFWIELSQNNV